MLAGKKDPLQSGPPASLKGSDLVTERVLAAIAELEIPHPWGVEEFSRSVSRHTARPIRIEHYPAAAKPSERPCGLLIRRESADVVFYDPSTSRYHAEHTILHELGHIVMDHFASPAEMIAGHDDVAVDVSNWLTEELTDVDADAISHVLCRTAFENDQEEEAELFASLLMSRRHRMRERGLSFRDTILGR